MTSRRTTPVLVRVVTMLLLAAGLTAGLGTGSSLGGAGERAGGGLAAYGFLRARVVGAGDRRVAVGMPNRRVVKVQRWVPATRSWTAPRTLFRSPGVTCGGIEAAASSGAIALLLECDTPYYEDTAPTHSMALVSRDLQTWATRRIRAEAYQPPAVSPGGGYAAWLTGGDRTMLWRADVGFGPIVTSGLDGDGGAETVVVDDTGAVDVLGAESDDAGRCVLGAHRRTLSGVLTHQVVPGVDPGCTEGTLVTTDDRHVVGDPTSPEQRYVLARTGTGGPWLVETPAPVDQPGLVLGAAGTTYVQVPGRSLVAVGSLDRRRFVVQAYDPVARAWRTAAPVHDFGPGQRCRPGSSWRGEGHRIYWVSLSCRRGDGPRSERLLTGPDGRRWVQVRLGRRPFAVSGGGGLLAAPGPGRATVVSEKGVARVRVRIDRSCDVVFPTSPTSVGRLHTRPGRAWPDRLQLRRPDGRWHTVQRLRVPRHDRCGAVFAEQDQPPTLLVLSGRRATLPLTIRRGPSGWRAVRTPGRF
ncbi:hypothetical protein [Nocardioides sp. SYSU D00038]|uniref:hypothetical protein n=1 Tax=Nocardioides sp. SYSU D00038 TaxID=2812554 RepID=UPI0019684165|nr:hypothetical protein [Nocardioides sp. SYSU D00038]